MPIEHALWATVAFGAGPFLFGLGFRRFRLKRLMENTPTAKVRSMAAVDSGIFASPTYLRERGTPRRPGELARHDCILRGGSGKKDRWELIGRGGTVVVAVDGRLRVDDLFTATAAAAAHAGLVVLPMHVETLDASALRRGAGRWTIRTSWPRPLRSGGRARPRACGGRAGRASAA